MSRTLETGICLTLIYARHRLGNQVKRAYLLALWLCLSRGFSMVLACSSDTLVSPLISPNRNRSTWSFPILEPFHGRKEVKMSQREDKIPNGPSSAGSPPRQPGPPPGFGDLIGSWCNMWGSFFMGLGQAISAPSCDPTNAGGVNQRTDATQQQLGPFSCGRGEFAFRWCGPAKSDQSKGTPQETEVSGRYDDQSRHAKVDISTGSNN